MKQLLAKDSERLIVIPDKNENRHLVTTPIKIFLACFFAGGSLVAFFFPVRDEFFKWIDNVGPFWQMGCVLVLLVIFSVVSLKKGGR